MSGILVSVLLVVSVFSLSITFSLRSVVVVDPFDYEQKYGEDKPYEEMGETGRMWKTYLSESAKVDADKVMSWTDALDVLLVFVSRTSLDCLSASQLSI